MVEITVTSTASSNGYPFGGGSSSAQGSGFVFDKAGHIVTNQHVVDGATTAQVRLSNGKTYSATVVGTDTSTDLAVLKIDAPAAQLHPVALADSSAVEVGDAVVAIGSPFGLEETITAGIVSALNRQIQATNGVTIGGAIQTDAAINHGNSGGPLIDMTGKVVGVNAQIESDSGDNAGVGFAIPSNTVKSVVAQILSGGTVEHAYLGVSIGDAGAQGATVETVQSGTPAARAGLRAGDVVTAVDGKSVADAAALTATVVGSRAGRQGDADLHARRLVAHRDRHARHAPLLFLSPPESRRRHRPGGAGGFTRRRRSRRSRSRSGTRSGRRFRGRRRGARRSRCRSSAGGSRPTSRGEVVRTRWMSFAGGSRS